MVTQQKFLNSIEYVVNNSDYVFLDESKIDQYVAEFAPSPHQNHWTKSYPLGELPTLSFDEYVDFFFLIGNQAFCFWGYPDKWTIEIHDQRLDGWWALVACFQRALESNVPILDGEYLRNLSAERAKQLFAGSPEIPLLPERIHMLQSIGQTLCEKYNGHFYNCYHQTEPDAFNLIDVLAAEFSGFDDVTTFHGKTVYFYKKAQVFVTDLNELLIKNNRPQLKNMVLMPGHADYKIPAMLRKMGVLHYNQELSDKVDSKTELSSGSEMEIEIRAHMLWALRQICDKLQKRNIVMDPSTLGGELWVKSQTKSPNDKPYHLTKTIYY